MANELGVELLEMETDRDHMHLLVEVDPQFGVNKFVKIASTG